MATPDARVYAARRLPHARHCRLEEPTGLENYAALKVALGGSGLSLVEEKSYPLGVKDLSPVLRGIKDKNPDAFIALSYPPDTILASKQSKEVGFNPKFFYASVGTAYPLYRQVMGAGAEGVLGMGSWNRKSSQMAEAYFDAHVKKFNKEPDRWASSAAWASLRHRVVDAQAGVGLKTEVIHRRGRRGGAEVAQRRGGIHWMSTLR